MRSIKQCIADISECKKILIVTHTNADADALCSSIALKRLIKKQFSTDTRPMTIDIVTDTPEIAELYAPFVKGVQFNEPTYKRYDMAIVLDCPNWSRTGKYMELAKKARKTVNIDHHETNEYFAKNNIVITASSVCEIIYLLFIHIKGWQISNETVRLLYAGVLTDTNDLSQNVFLNTHKVIDLMQKSQVDDLASFTAVRDYLFKNTTKQKLSLEQRALQSLSFFEKDRIAIMKITKQDLTETNCKQEDTLGIVDNAIKLKGVDIAIIFIKQENNSYYISLRSKNEIDVGAIALSMGGGGHANVAAFQSSENLTDIRAKLIALCKVELQKHTKNDLIQNLFAEYDENEEQTSNSLSTPKIEQIEKPITPVNEPEKSSITIQKNENIVKKDTQESPKPSEIENLKKNDEITK